MKIIKKITVLALLLALAFFGGEYCAKKLYPVKYLEYINKYSDLYELDPYLIMSVIKAESNFDHEAVSNKEATGLMQITRGTANWIAEKLLIAGFDYENDILSPELNINMGSFYIDYLMEMYDENTDCALAAYNAGFKNVDSWLSDSKYSKDGVSLDKIPFPETERYVDKVKNNHRIYQFLYKEAVN